MTRTLAPLYLAAGMVAGLWTGNLGTARPSSATGGAAHADERQTPAPARVRAEAGILSQLDALDARIAALAYPDPRHCDDACLTGVERVELRRGVVSCRCRKLPSLGVHRIPEGR